MKGGEDEMAGGSRLNGKRNRFQVAELADQDDVRILAQGASEGGCEAFRVPPHLAVVHDTALTCVDKLYRILDRDDVVLPGPIRLVDDRCKRCRLAASRRAGDQNQSPGQGGQLGDDLGQPQILCRGNLVGNLAEDRSASELLLKKVGAVTGDPRDLIAKVHVPRLLKLLDLVLGSDLVDHRLEVIIGKNVEFDPLHIPPNPERRLLT